ncbi:hypothetical protein BDQ17DRAFT_1428634 [Cyathus striatus]|nr:hypothetical protein BDQ17DRAFT_1428634 [Cyathus striatus]
MGKILSFPPIKRLIAKNVKIISFFSSSHYWGGQLEELAKEHNITRGLKKNVETQFYAVILQAISIQEHKQILFKICSHDDAQCSICGLSPIKRDVIESVMELDHWQLNEEFICICKPLVDVIGDTKSRDATLADCMIQLIWAHHQINNLPDIEFKDKEFL